MRDPRFSDNPAFRQYVRLLYELHIAIKEGWDETKAGEAIRDRMDGLGSDFSGEEVAALNGISAHLTVHSSIAHKPNKNIR